VPKFYSARDTVNAFVRAGFVKVSQKGSHIKLKGIRDKKLSVVIIPNQKEIPIGTFSSILKQANMTRQEFETYI